MRPHRARVAIVSRSRATSRPHDLPGAPPAWAGSCGYLHDVVGLSQPTHAASAPRRSESSPDQRVVSACVVRQLLRGPTVGAARSRSRPNPASALEVMCVGLCARPDLRARAAFVGNPCSTRQQDGGGINGATWPRRRSRESDANGRRCRWAPVTEKLLWGVSRGIRRAVVGIQTWARRLACCTRDSRRSGTGMDARSRASSARYAHDPYKYVVRSRALLLVAERGREDACSGFPRNGIRRGRRSCGHEGLDTNVRRRRESGRGPVDALPRPALR